MPACEEIPIEDVIPEWDDRNDILAASNVALSEYARYLQERQYHGFRL